MVDHYQMMSVTEKGASRPKDKKEEAKMYKHEFKNVSLIFARQDKIFILYLLLHKITFHQLSCGM